MNKELKQHIKTKESYSVDGGKTFFEVVKMSRFIEDKATFKFLSKEGIEYIADIRDVILKVEINVLDDNDNIIRTEENIGKFQYP